MSKESKEVGSTDSDAGAVETLTDSVGDLITGIPAPIRKNAMKAFNRLCTAAVEYPVAVIEGAIEERRALSTARVKIIQTSAAQISSQMLTDPEFARIAVAKYGQKILRERINVDNVSAVAAKQLQSSMNVELPNKEDETEANISDDWLNAFEAEAAQMSSEQMQNLFGKILAREIRRPKSYSIKTLKLMAQLDNDAAVLFQKLCSLTVSLRIGNSTIVDARVISMGNPSQNSLAAYGLGFGSLNILFEYGLIISDFNSYMDYHSAIARDNKVGLPFTYQNAQWALVADNERPPFQEFRVEGVSLSKSGLELLPIVDIEADEAYSLALEKHFKNHGMTMVKVSINNEPK